MTRVSAYVCTPWITGVLPGSGTRVSHCLGIASKSLLPCVTTYCYIMAVVTRKLWLVSSRAALLTVLFFHRNIGKCFISSRPVISNYYICFLFNTLYKNMLFLCSVFIVSYSFASFPLFFILFFQYLIISLGPLCFSVFYVTCF